MAFRKAAMRCCECGQPFLRRPSRPGKALCIPCAVRRVQDSAMDLHLHEGYYYQKWLVSMQKAMARLEAEEAAKQQAATRHLKAV